MTDKEAFKFGFLLRCAQEGLTPEETRQRIEKTAALKRADFDPLAAMRSVGKGALLTALVAPPAVGALGGYALATAHDDNYDVDEAKKEEELAEYYRAIDQLGRSNRLQTIA